MGAPWHMRSMPPLGRLLASRWSVSEI